MFSGIFSWRWHIRAWSGVSFLSPGPYLVDGGGINGTELTESLIKPQPQPAPILLTSRSRGTLGARLPLLPRFFFKIMQFGLRSPLGSKLRWAPDQNPGSAPANSHLFLKVLFHWV